MRAHIRGLRQIGQLRFLPLNEANKSWAGWCLTRDLSTGNIAAFFLLFIARTTTLEIIGFLFKLQVSLKPGCYPSSFMILTHLDPYSYDNVSVYLSYLYFEYSFDFACEIISAVVLTAESKKCFSFFVFHRGTLLKGSMFIALRSMIQRQTNIYEDNKGVDDFSVILKI